MFVITKLKNKYFFVLVTSYRKIAYDILLLNVIRSRIVAALILFTFFVVSYRINTSRHLSPRWRENSDFCVSVETITARFFPPPEQF